MILFCHNFFLGASISQTISFHALLTVDITLRQSQTVVFDRIITNSDNAYNRHSGIFTAPKNGTYFFSTSFLSRNGSVHLQIMRNAEIIGGGTAFPDHGSSGSMSAVVYLKTGDLIKIRHWIGHGSQTIHGGFGMFSSFII